MEVPEKTKSGVTIWSKNFTPGQISEKSSNLKRHMYLNVQKSIVYNSQTWKQLKCPSTEEGIKKMWYITQRNITQPWKGLEQCNLWEHGWMFLGDHTRWSKPDRRRQISYNIAYMWNTKKNEIICKTEIDSQTQNTNLWLPKFKKLEIN